MGTLSCWRHLLRPHRRYPAVRSQRTAFLLERHSLQRECLRIRHRRCRRHTCHSVLSRCGVACQGVRQLDGIRPCPEHGNHAQARGWNGTLNGPFSSDTVRYTLSVPPTSVHGNRTAAGPACRMALRRFGVHRSRRIREGTVQYYAMPGPVGRWPAVHIRSGVEPAIWRSTLPPMEVVYLHVTGYNGDDVPHGSLNLGPYVYQQSTRLGLSPSPMRGRGRLPRYAKRLLEEASQGSSPIAGYEYAVGHVRGCCGCSRLDGCRACAAGGGRRTGSQEGQTYYIGTRAKRRRRNRGPDAVRRLHRRSRRDRIGQIWRCRTGRGSSLRGKTVTAALPGVFWLEEMDRTASRPRGLRD